MDHIRPGLSVGSKGDNVALPPEALRQVGFTIDDPAGVFGQATHRAVIEFQQSRGLPTPGDVDDRTAVRIEQTNKRIVAGTSAVVHGGVLPADGFPMPGITVKAFHKTVRREVLLEEATTTRASAYLIRGAVAELRDAGAVVDLMVCAYASGDAEKVLIESSVVADAPVDVELDLRATTSASRGLSEYELLRDAINPLLDGAEPAQLSAEQDQYLPAKTGANGNAPLSVLPLPVESPALIRWGQLPGRHARARPAIGALLTMTQSRAVLGTALGQPLYFLAVASGEDARLAVVDWTRRVFAAAHQQGGNAEALTKVMPQNRSFTKVTHAAAEKTQQGRSGSGTSSGASGAGIGIGYGSVSGAAGSGPCQPFNLMAGLASALGFGAAAGMGSGRSRQDPRPKAALSIPATVRAASCRNRSSLEVRR